MAPEPPSDPLNDPEYLRGESRRLRKIIERLSDPEIKKELASHSLYLAQRAEALERLAEDPAFIQMKVEWSRAVVSSEIAEDGKPAVKTLLDQAEKALAGPKTLRERSNTYRRRSRWRGRADGAAEST